jgi:hypothetical protein
MTPAPQPHHELDIALLDIEIDADPATSRLIAARPRWAAG